MTGLVKKINSEISTNKKLKGVVVVLTEDGPATEKQLTELAKKESIDKIPLTMFLGKEGPEDYQIAEKADVTVLMWVKTEIKVNYAFAKGDLDADKVDAIVKDLSKILE